jgi:hypothetical protein
MRKQKKSRVESVGVLLYKGHLDTYYLTVPYDKKNRVIPSSVECAFNSRYFDLDQTVAMLRAL